MAPSDGSNLDHPVDLDDDDLSPSIRQFLESIAERDSTGVSAADRRREVERERRVTRFAWTCEELNVAFGDLRADDRMLALLVDHGVRVTLLELQSKCAALLESIDANTSNDEPA
jgi:hypothetical protein